MNIGQIKQNDAGIFMGRISTLAVAMTIALKPVQSANPRAPRFPPFRHPCEGRDPDNGNDPPEAGSPGPCLG